MKPKNLSEFHDFSTFNNLHSRPLILLQMGR